MEPTQVSKDHLVCKRAMLFFIFTGVINVDVDVGDVFFSSAQEE